MEVGRSSWEIVGLMEMFLLLVLQMSNWDNVANWARDRLWGTRVTSGLVGLKPLGTAPGPCFVKSSHFCCKVLCKEKCKSKMRQHTGKNCALFWLETEKLQCINWSFALLLYSSRSIFDRLKTPALPLSVSLLIVVQSGFFYSSVTLGE